MSIKNRLRNWLMKSYEISVRIADIEWISRAQCQLLERIEKLEKEVKLLRGKSDFKPPPEKQTNPDPVYLSLPPRIRELVDWDKLGYGEDK